jgi:lysophospholipase
VAEQAAFDRRAIPAGAAERLWQAADGHPIRVIDWPAPPGDTEVRGRILFMPGRGDFYEKYLETLEHWRINGWQVRAADWRGQAGSGRLGAAGNTGHIDDFGIWIDDLAQLWRDFASTGAGPMVLAAHSMGGHLALRAVIERALDPAPAALVLSAPMLDVVPEHLPSFAKRAYAAAMVKLGEPSRAAWKVSEKPGSKLKLRQMLLTHSRSRYADEEWWRGERPYLSLGPGSWGWLKAAMNSVALIFRRGALESVDVPVLFVATNADKLVSPAAIRRAIDRIPGAEACLFGKQARHEILRESDKVRLKAWAAIDAFLARHVPR